jgi:hypothetical protein
LTARTDFVGDGEENIAAVEGDGHEERIRESGEVGNHLESTVDNDAARDGEESHPSMDDGGEDYSAIVDVGRYLLRAEDLLIAWVMMHPRSTFFAANQLCVLMVANVWPFLETFPESSFDHPMNACVVETLMSTSTGPSPNAPLNNSHFPTLNNFLSNSRCGSSSCSASCHWN